MNAHIIIIFILILIILGMSIAGAMYNKPKPAEQYAALPKRKITAAPAQSQASKCATRQAECNSKTGASKTNCLAAIKALGC